MEKVHRLFVLSCVLARFYDDREAYVGSIARGDGVMRKLVALSVLTAGAILSLIDEPLAAAPVDPIGHKVTVIRDRFVDAVRACGAVPRFEPAVSIATEPGVISYRASSHALIIGRWSALPPPIQSFFSQWATHDMPGQSGEALFDTLFNGFLVGHELGHWVADQSDRHPTLDHYDAEIEANRFAIAFSDLTDRERTKDMVGRFSYLSTLPNPVPAGEDARAWFDAHYWDMARTNPLAYNWYQGRFMRQAWQQRSMATFCELVGPDPQARQ